MILSLNQNYQHHLKIKNEVLYLSETKRDDYKDEILLIYKMKCLIASNEKPSSIYIEGRAYDCFWSEDEVIVYGETFHATFTILNQKIVDYTLK